MQPTAIALVVYWEPVADGSVYDLAWREDGATDWESTRTSVRPWAVTGVLTAGALYWVRVRAVKTAGGPSGQTLYMTDWSAPELAVAGDWTPQNLQVTPGDRSLTVTWDSVAGADDYEVRWRPTPEASSGNGDGVSGSVEVPTSPVGVPVWSSALADRAASGWRAVVIGLDNGEEYTVEVRALRRFIATAGVVTLRSKPASMSGTSGLGFEVHGSPSGPPVVWSGGDVIWTVTLRHAGSLGPTGYQPYANRPISGRVSSGPSKGHAVTCVQEVILASPGPRRGDVEVDCVTDDEGQVALRYPSEVVATNAQVGVDTLVVFVDYDGDGELDGNEGSSERPVGTTRVARPVNLVALGDSYTAGENGDPELRGSHDFTGHYYETAAADSHATTTLAGFSVPADTPCRRWTEAYSQRLEDLSAEQPLMFSSRQRIWACTGAISLNISHPNDLGTNNAVYSIYRFDEQLVRSSEDPTVLDPLIVAMPETIARPSQEDTRRPAPSYEFIKGRHEESRQEESLSSFVTNRLGSIQIREGVDLVVLTIGGNDIGFADILRSCLEESCLRLDKSPGSTPVAREKFQEDIVDRLDCNTDESDTECLVRNLTYIVGYDLKPIFDELSTRLVKVFRSLRNSANQASVVVLGYPQLVPDDSDFVRGCDGLDSVWADPLKRLDLTEQERAFLRQGTVMLNETISAAAARAGVHFVPVAGVFDGHETCTNKAAWINGLEIGFGRDEPYGQSFHPNRLGQRAYAEALLAYIDDAIRRVENPQAELNAGGMPVNPAVSGTPSSGGISGSAGGSSGGSGGAAASPGGGSEESTQEPAVPAYFVVRDFLSHRRLVAASSACGGGFFSPGEVVVLSASGFAPGAAVVVSIRSAAAPWTSVTESTLPAATADGDGNLEVRWTVPTVAGSAPRAYAFEASGAGASGGTLEASSAVPVVAYPTVAPCAVSDTASTTVGQAVRVAVLGNDVAPTGGSLAASSLTVDAADGASASVGADGAVTVTPEAGFVGTAVMRYTVADSWGVRVSARVTITVNAGCTITGAAGVELISGTDGDDVICVPDFGDRGAFHVIDAKAGDDVIVGGHGVEWVHAGAGADVVYGRGGADRVNGGAGVDTIYSGPGADLVYGDDLADTVHDSDGYEFLLIAPARAAHTAPVVGDDVAQVAVGEVVEVAVLGNDYDPNENLVVTSLSVTAAPTLGTALAVYRPERGVVVRYAAGSEAGTDTFTYEVCDTLDACATAQVTVTVGTAGCTIVGTLGDDSLRGTPGDDVICGLAGDDVIHGGGGNDVIVGGAGDDLLSGGQGDDVIWGGDGDDGLSGGRGDDVVVGGDGDDVVYGDDGDDVLWGGPGNDYLGGGPGEDVLHGGVGNDTLWGDPGDDVLWGGAGNDALHGNPGADTLWGGPGADWLRGNTQNDILWGGPGNDTLVGGGHDDRLLGGAGNDTLQGDGGDDRLWGDPGDDSLDGGSGTDYSDGGGGTDTCRRAKTTARCEP